MLVPWNLDLGWCGFCSLAALETRSRFLTWLFPLSRAVEDAGLLGFRWGLGFEAVFVGFRESGFLGEVLREDLGTGGRDAHLERAAGGISKFAGRKDELQ